MHAVGDSHQKGAHCPLDANRYESNKFLGAFEPPYRHKGLHCNGLKVKWLVYWSVLEVKTHTRVARATPTSPSCLRTPEVIVR